MAESGSPMSILPVPADYTIEGPWGLAFTVMSYLLALGMVPWVVGRWRGAKQDSMPILALAGGAICCLFEPILDTLGHLWFALNLPGWSISAYGLRLPLFLPAAYAFFTGMTGYYAYRIFQEKPTVKRVFQLWLTLGVVDVLLEYPAVLSRVYTFYGDQPWEFFSFPWWFAWINSTAMIAIGFGLWLSDRLLIGKRRILTLLVPLSSFAASYGMTAWPAFLVVNAPMPVWCSWVISGFSFVLCALLIRLMAEVVGNAASGLSNSAPDSAVHSVLHR